MNDREKRLRLAWKLLTLLLTSVVAWLSASCCNLSVDTPMLKLHWYNPPTATNGIPPVVHTNTMKKLDVPQSGSMAGTTASRNRFGQYDRTRAIPVNPRTASQGAVRDRLSVNSAAWRSLTDAQRAGWTTLGASIVRTDSLGQSYSLTGFQAFCSVNNNLLLVSEAALSDAPAITTPVGLATATITTTGGTLSIAYTATPLPASTHLIVYASPQVSPGRSYQGDLRIIGSTAAAAASPYNALAGYTAKFGAPITGQKIFFDLRASKGGFLSGPFFTSKLVTA